MQSARRIILVVALVAAITWLGLMLRALIFPPEPDWAAFPRTAALVVAIVAALAALAMRTR